MLRFATPSWACFALVFRLAFLGALGLASGVLVKEGDIKYAKHDRTRWLHSKMCARAALTFRWQPGDDPHWLDRCSRGRRSLDPGHDLATAIVLVARQ